MPRPFAIRPLQPADRTRVRELCCETGFLGNPIDPVFEDRELFADYLTSYYTDREPESSFVLLYDGQIEGYLLGSRHPSRQKLYNLGLNLRLALRGALRYWRYNAASRAFVRWILANAWREVPAAPHNCPHFHVNLLPQARSVAVTRELLLRYLGYLRACGEKQVHGQMVTFENRRGEKLFERYGFRVLNRARISKYDGIHPEPVYLCTVITDLNENTRLYSANENL